ncbi:MAG: hypothetical protein HFG97_07245 [Dorea sp.]|nr:hypothetical protein [Dorea sp.]
MRQRKRTNWNEATSRAMDELGTLELEILKSFDEFSDTIERIQNRPQFKEYTKDGVKLPAYDKETLKKVSVGAGVLLGGLGGAAVGAAGGFAAAGATTSAIMALGTASTGTAIASLSGVAATNATLAALGGGGIALGTTILGATTLGAALLVGGVIFNITGGKLSDKADEAWEQMKKAEKTIDFACRYLNELKAASVAYKKSLLSVRDKYKEIFGYVSYTVNSLHKTDWHAFSQEEKIATENSVLLIGLLYKMCQVSLVNKAKYQNDLNSVYISEINESISNADNVMKSLA